MIPFKKLDPRATLPTRNHSTDAGIDLYALEDTVIPSIPQYVWSYIKKWADKLFHVGYIWSDPEDNNLCVKVRTGIACKLPTGTCGKIFDRSSIGSKLILTSAGVIDETYLGELLVCVYNLSFFSKEIKAGEKFAQMVVININQDSIEEVQELEATERGEKGFGSSGS